MATSKFAVEDVFVKIRNVIVTGFVDGDFVEIERGDDQVSLVRGTHGENAFVEKRVTDGSITITTMGGSAANDQLQLLKDEQDIGSGVTFDIQITDLHGRKLAHSRDAKIVKDPNIKFGNTIAPVEWPFLCADLFMRQGGNT